MRNQEQRRFTVPADSTRPFKSHRYDVFGVKIARRLTLFGDQNLSAFIALEADPSVLAYCERPIVIKDLKPKRVVDFCVVFRRRLHQLIGRNARSAVSS